MANIFGNKNTQQLSQREQLANKYMSARHNLLLVVIFTVINIVLILVNSNTYFLFSASIPYYLVDTGMFYCGKYPMEFYAEMSAVEFFPNSYLVVMIVITVVILGLYLLAWIFSKKPRVGWMIFALVFFALDTVFMLCAWVITADMIIDIVFHAWVVISLTNGIISYFKLKKLPEELLAEEQLPQEFAEE